jgi:hypothetical protein
MTEVAPSSLAAAAAQERDDAAAVELPAGPAAAVMIAVAVAAVVLGVLSTLTAISSSVSRSLTFSDRVGDLSGVSTLTVGAFFASWLVLGLLWRRADPPLRTVALATALGVAVGLVGTFPPFFHLLD